MEPGYDFWLRSSSLISGSDARLVLPPPSFLPAPLAVSLWCVLLQLYLIVTRVDLGVFVSPASALSLLRHVIVRCTHC